MIDSAKLVTAMQAAGMSQGGLAKAAGTTPASIWRIIHRGQEPRSALLARIEDALGVQPRSLSASEAA